MQSEFQSVSQYTSSIFAVHKRPHLILTASNLTAWLHGAPRTGITGVGRVLHWNLTLSISAVSFKLRGPKNIRRCQTFRLAFLESSLPLAAAR